MSGRQRRSPRASEFRPSFLSSHGHMFSDFWLAVPGHDGVLTSTDLRSSKSSDRMRHASTRISPPHERVLREQGRAFGSRRGLIHVG